MSVKDHLIWKASAVYLHLIDIFNPKTVFWTNVGFDLFLKNTSFERYKTWLLFLSLPPEHTLFFLLNSTMLSV